MVILHEENSHFNLIIPRNSKLAIEGGLDYQRKEEQRKIEAKKVEKKDEIDNSDLVSRIKSLEEKLVTLGIRCQKLEAENKKLRLNNKTSSNEEEEYSCEKCDCMFESISVLNNHMKSHVEHKTKHKCVECDAEFSTEVQLRNHAGIHHQDDSVKARQFNCDDCAFQGENSLELKRHVQRTKHNPSEYKEECHTCKKEFTSYWLLMNHRKSEHPSNKKCRYFKLEQCNFNAKTCWYKHTAEDRYESHQNEEGCNFCELIFRSKSELMKHMKSVHIEKVAVCRNYRQGAFPCLSKPIPTPPSPF